MESASRRTCGHRGGERGFEWVGALVAVLAFVLAPAFARAERRVAVYAPKHRLAAELGPLAQVALDGVGDVAVDRGTNRLVLMGEAEAIARTLALLAEQDRRLRTIVLRYDTARGSVLEAWGFDVAWNAEIGGFRVGRLRGADGSGTSMHARGTAGEDRLAETLRGRIRVVEGGTTRIETGEAVPYASTGPFGTDIGIVDATTGFEAKPRILRDGRVRVDLAGFADRFGGGDGRDGAIASMRTSTLVDLEPGSAVVVGVLDSSGSRSGSTGGVGGATVRLRDETLLLLRADVEE